MELAALSPSPSPSLPSALPPFSDPSHLQFYASPFKPAFSPLRIKRAFLPLTPIRPARLLVAPHGSCGTCPTVPHNDAAVEQDGDLLRELANIKALMNLKKKQLKAQMKAQAKSLKAEKRKVTKAKGCSSSSSSETSDCECKSVDMEALRQVQTESREVDGAVEVIDTVIADVPLQKASGDCAQSSDAVQALSSIADDRSQPPILCSSVHLACSASLDPSPISRGNGFSSPPILFSALPLPLIFPALSAADTSSGYSQASYFTSLGLFALSVPGLWSLIKRSTKSKIVQKTFVVPGPASDQGKSPSQVAGEITSFFTRNNFLVADRGETVTFEGIIVPSRAQAALLIFCTCISLGSIALVLTITVPDLGDRWYWLSALSPLAGVYYWTKASRKEQIKVKMVVSDDEASTDVIVQGDDDQVDRLRRELSFMEKGMVYVKGILER